MTVEEALATMIGGGSGSSGNLPDLEKPELVEYVDVDDYNGDIIEHYKVGTDEEYTQRIRVNFSNKGTINEQVYNLRFYDKDDVEINNISFSGFYVG